MELNCVVIWPETSCDMIRILSNWSKKQNMFKYIVVVRWKLQLKRLLVAFQKTSSDKKSRTLNSTSIINF